MIKGCIAFKTTLKDSLIVLPTGDGMVIGFFQSPELPLNLSLELHRKIGIYNRAKIPTEALRLRIGYCDIQPVIIESNKEHVIARWKKRNIFQGQSFRLEWK